MPIAGLFLIPLTFWPHFVPLSLRPGRIGAALANGAFFALPLVVFLLLVVVVMPPFIQTWFGFEFDYLSETLLINGTQRTGTSLVNGLFASLTPWTVLENVTNLFGLSLLPRQVSELTPSPFGQYPGGQVTNLPKIVVLLAFFGLAAFVAVRTRAPFARYARGYLVALALFFVFLTALSIRHIPTVTGYYYGAGFAALFAILIGLLVAGLSRLAPLARPLAALAVLGIVAVQIDNFEPINAGSDLPPQRAVDASAVVGHGAGAPVGPAGDAVAVADRHRSERDLGRLEAGSDERVPPRAPADAGRPLRGAGASRAQPPHREGRRQLTFVVAGARGPIPYGPIVSTARSTAGRTPKSWTP